ncbi:hypothetical protein BDV06DRAFT_45867 [Aspergillus oleicola]
MAPGRYTLEEVLAVAQLHPFYNSLIEYPPCEKAIEQVLAQKRCLDIQSQPLLQKKSIYKVVKRLATDTNAQNAYRESSYLSITGGGSGGIPMMFAVDVHENRAQRAEIGRFIRLCKLVHPRDWVLSTHVSGGLYRSLDLMTELFESAGATVLSAGNFMTPHEIIPTLIHYRVNVLTGDSSQIVQIIYHISQLERADRENIVLDKIIYTSEPLTDSQRAFIRATCGDIKIYSVLGSAEAGPWTVSNPDLTESGKYNNSSSVNFIFDTRNMLVEIFPLAILDTSEKLVFDPISERRPTPLPSGETGLVVQTSLQRLRNPLVRYITGDVGSLHALPDSAHESIPESERPYLRILRMQGRDRRFSFEWYGVYFEFEKLKALMLTEELGILQWQVILYSQGASDPQVSLQVRLLRAPGHSHAAGILAEKDLLKQLWDFFLVLPENEHLFHVDFVENIEGFERSSTAGKVINFVDRVH